MTIPPVQTAAPVLSSDQLRAVLASPEHRRTFGLELPQASLHTLAINEAAFDTFYSQWTAQGQPRYVPPVAEAAPVADVAPVAAPAPAPAVMPTPVPPRFAPAMSPYGPPPRVVPEQLPGQYPAQYPIQQPTRAFYAAGFTGSPNDAMTPMSRVTRPGFTSMMWGFGVAALGIGITIVTYLTAAPGQTFVVAWGSILFGSIRGVTGAVRMARGR